MFQGVRIVPQQGFLGKSSPLNISLSLIVCWQEAKKESEITKVNFSILVERNEVKRAMEYNEVKKVAVSIDKEGQFRTSTTFWHQNHC